MSTIKEVAKRAKTSITTVSRVINNTSYVKEETRQKVLQAMKELNYRPLTREPVVKENRSLALVVPDVSNPFFGKIAKGIATVANKFVYNIILCNIDGIPAGDGDYLMDLIKNRVDGVIYASSYRIGEVVRKARDNNIPIVIFDREVRDFAVDTVTINNNQGAYLATEHLILSGHKKIAFIGGSEKFQVSEQRKKGYMRALKEHGIYFDEGLIFTGDFTMESGFKAMNLLLLNKKPFTACIAANDLMAIGAINCLNQHGIMVPEEISVIGFDDISLASAMTPKLTTVAYPIERISERSLELLMKQISDINSSPEIITLFPRLIIRESTTGSKGMERGAESEK
ncbi:MAG: hypothetical protein PWQ96_2096 [Clostridia bacterium]|jgi:DNA-binding LacI/PurR family transcriptional regulator|nr:LacI family transcriptional regulator [Clostridiales bacterium]MDK2986452.1 hypothetical protein [Clostridia bacterium]